MKKPMIEFIDFSFQYNAQAKPTLHQINLTIYEGEKVLIVGPSGSGKSTLAHCINGLVPNIFNGKITGKLLINDRYANKDSIFERSNLVGTVLQNPDDQFIGLTVGEDIAFKLENTNVLQHEMYQTVKAVAKLVDIESYLAQSPHDLSGGQKQRVTLGGILVDDIDILLFDEPLANLDPAAGKHAIELIDQIQNRTKKTSIMIEHRLEDVLHCSVDRVIVVDGGRIVADLSPNELLASSILENVGIREPLYITALKYAGCEVTKDLNLEHINHINLDEATLKLKEWYELATDHVAPTYEDVLLEFDSVSYGYKIGHQTITDLSFKLYKGEMVSLVGKNGAGKSTISKLIAGFMKPTHGSIKWKGKNLVEQTIKERAEKIGLVMQNPNQMISKTMIFDEVALGLRVRGYSEEIVVERVEETLKICGLYPYRNWPISALSFGQKKRVSIAAILVLNPELLILDEPTAGQDLKHYTEIMDFLVELNKRGVTILMITHDMHLMLEYTNRAIVIGYGKLLADDTTWNVLTNLNLIEQANLKRTSLYDLAKRCGIDSPVDFVSRFIANDKAVRLNEQ